MSTRSKGWVVTGPKDVKVGPDFPNLLWCKQKWLCRNISCVRKQFTESVPQIPPRARLTARDKAEMAAAVLDGWRSVSEVSAAYGTTWDTCHAAVVAMADPVLALPRTLRHEILVATHARSDNVPDPDKEIFALVGS